MPPLGEIGELPVLLRIGAEQLAACWRIQNFRSLSKSVKASYISPKFKIGDESWYLRLYPNWRREARQPASGWLELAFYRCDGGPPSNCNIAVGIRGTAGVEKRKEVEREFSGNDCHFQKYFCPRSDLIEHKTRLLPGGILSITFLIKRTGSVSSHPSTRVAPTNKSQSSDKRGCEKLLEDLAKLLSSGEKSDVTVQVDDIEFKVHSVILFARSPALSVSLQHESKEKASNRIVVEDCEPGIFRDFLEYLYTGSIQSLTQKNVFGLHRVADKYLADDLKQQCLEHIRDTLCVQTFCDTIKLALMHGEIDLFQQATDFATRNIQSIIVSVEWQNFICEYPRHANEILIKCFGTPVPS